MRSPMFSFGRRVATVGFAFSMALVSAIGFSAATAAATPARAATASVPRCATRSLRIWVGRSGVAMGTVGDEFGFTNYSVKTCSLYGYPQVQLLEKSGRNQSTSDHKASPGVLGIEEKLVVLAPGKTAYFGVIFHDQTGFAKLTCPTSAALRFTPPQNTATVTLRGTDAQIAAYHGTIEHLVCGYISVTPVTAKRFQ